MRDFLNWIADNSGTLVPILGGAAVLLLGGAVGAIYTGYYTVAGIAGGLGILSGAGAGAVHIVDQNRRIEQLTESNRVQAITNQGLENVNRTTLATNTQLLGENRELAQTNTVQRGQIVQLTNQRDQRDIRIGDLEEERNELRRRTTDDSFQIRIINEQLRFTQNERDILNRRIEELERQDRLHTVSPPREDIRVSQSTAGTFGPRVVHRRNRNDGGGHVNNLNFG